ncbi:MAG: Rieske (2Fe-2S) protein [Actinomycetota bacterium]|nr:Rieske (2Fe-2S) protein [Actinomycetota bacterium]
MSFEPVARSGDVRGPRFLRATAHGQPVLLSRLSDGTAVAFGTICPHQDKPLDEGTLWDDAVDCPHRHYTYDPVSGENLFPKRVFPADRARGVRGIRTYQVREDGGWVLVGPRHDNQEP